MANRLGVALAQSATNRAHGPGRVIPLPNVRQRTDYTCGPASLHAILRYFGAASGADEMALARMMGTTAQRGTEPNDLVRAARRLGLRPKSKVGMNIDELARQTRRGNPVIVLFQAWSTKPESYPGSYADGHYAVVIGVDAKNVYLQDPWAKTARAFVPREAFAQRWHGLDNGKPVVGLGITIPSSGHSLVPSFHHTLVRAD